MTTSLPASLPAALAASPDTARGSAVAPTAADDKLGRDFEAVFLSQFVDQMMKTVDYGPASGGQGAEMWRSFLSDALAERLADRGGLGLGDSIGRMLAAYRR